MEDDPSLPPRPDATAQRSPAGGIGAFVVGLVSVFGFFPFGVILGPIAIVMGRKSRRRAAGLGTGSRLATAGIVLGWIGLIVGAFFWVALSVCDCL